MTTWKCGGCGVGFSKPESVLFHSGQSGNGSENWEEDEYIDVCPVCGHDYFYEVFYCDGCGKEFDEEDILDEDDLCAECSAKAAAYDEMVDRVKEALSTPIDMEQIVKQIITKPKGE